MRSTEEGEYFYVLDGFGAVHTNDPDFDYGSLPYFWEDNARDLEPDPDSDGWLVLDKFGLIHSSQVLQYDVPLELPYTGSSDLNLYAQHFRAFARFADQSTVLLDAYGGRHTNRWHPAENLLQGVSPNLYFPGWPILGDAEIVPHAWN